MQIKDLTWSKGEEEEEEEEEDEDIAGDDEEENDASASSTEKSAEETQKFTRNHVTCDLPPKPEELKEESVPDGEQRAAEISEQPDATAGQKTDGDAKPANGTTGGDAKTQSGANKKLSLFRRLSSSRSKQADDGGPTPAEAPVQGEPPAPACGPHQGGAVQPPGASRGPRSGACTVL
ncbi:uncharacterized protein DDB_G0286299-like [Stegastes partitus]|uniref:Uncharacterized protein DDB_G0286299-like n=1 Tax=Stegastes partitus TaxID=144197 RepID=A0A9Y4K727_9TELE|nr:PREDICTED: uncharacterized protein DDB_G0286299-like [Stegastes partitus]